MIFTEQLPIIGGRVGILGYLILFSILTFVPQRQSLLDRELSP